MKRTTYFLRLLIVFTFVLCCKEVEGQDTIQTLFSRNNKFSVHYFWAPSINLYFQHCSFDERTALFAELTGGCIINKHIILGLTMCGKVTPSTFYHPYTYINDNGTVTFVPDQKSRVGYGYGGIVFGVIIAPYHVLHIYASILLGGGSANEYIVQDNGSHGTTFNSPGFFVCKPSICTECNISKKLRAWMGINYQSIRGTYFESLSTAQLSGVSFITGIKIGSF